MEDEREGPAASGETAPATLVRPARRASIATRLRNYFLTGVVVTAPIGITIYLAWIFVEFVDKNVTPWIPEQYQPETYLKVSIPGLGIVIAVIALTLIGFLTANFLGRSLIGIGERLVERMPVIRTVYSALKQIFETVLKQSSRAFREVVLVEYPRKNSWVIAFVTAGTEGEIRRKAGTDLVSLFVPTTPNPTSGFLLFVPREDVMVLDMTVEEAMKLVVSAGMVSPPDRAAPGYVAPDKRRGARRGIFGPGRSSTPSA